jgi:Preprotein translocase subunit YidC
LKEGKKALALFGALSLVLVLSACSTDPVNSQSTGFWDHYIIWNFVRAIKALSNLFGGSYGWGIIIFTIIVRIIILPLMFYQIKSSRKTMDLQPQLKELQAKYPDRDQDSMRAMQEEQKNYMLKLELIQLPVAYHCWYRCRSYLLCIKLFSDLKN